MISTVQNVYRRRYYWFVFGPEIFEEDTISCSGELLERTSWMPGVIEFYDNTPRQRLHVDYVKNRYR